MQEWRYAAGWTKYDNETGAAIPVDFPEEDGLVFDIEVLVREGHFPTMATALSHKHWYNEHLDYLLCNGEGGTLSHHGHG